MESGIGELFQMGGVAMFPLALLAGLALPASLILPLVALVSKKHELGMAMALVGLGFLAIAVGVLGQQLGLRTMEEAIAAVNPIDRETIRMAGQSEARVCLIFGLLVGLAPISVGTALVGTGLARSVAGPGLLLKLSTVVLGVGLLALGAGAVAQQASTHLGERGHALADPSSKQTILAASQSDGAARMRLGLLFGVPGLLMGAGMLTAGIGRANREAKP